MTTSQYLKNLNPPCRKVDAVIDTDAFNEIDDQFAISYMLKSPDRINVKAILAAPFFNDNSVSPADGMEKSYNEILKLLDLAGMPDMKKSVFKGSDRYLRDENTPVNSAAAEHLVSLSGNYTADNPLYIVAIGAITNVASAFLLCPEMKERTVVVWLGGHALHIGDTREFNMRQDIAAARIVMGCGVPFVQLPCVGVVDAFTTTRYELEHWLAGKNPLSDYLAKNTIAASDCYTPERPWSRVIWDVTAAAWLLNDNGRFMQSHLIPSPIPEYDGKYASDPSRHFIRCVCRIHRDALMTDLFSKLTQN